jgi:hypothetical protein
MLKYMRNELGGTLVLYTVAMVGMMGMAALAIDLGMLRKAKAEAQRAADAAALAGASAFQLDLSVTDEVDSANVRANRVASQNYMNGVAFDPPNEITVVVIPDSVKVRVTARRAAVPTWFARIFGINTLPVGAKAAAVADFASGVSCSKPLAISDMWQDSNDDGDHYPESGEDWTTYDNPPDSYFPAHYQGDGTGIGLGSNWRDPVLRDWGLPIMLRPSGAADGDDVCAGDLQGGKCFYPSFWGLWEATNSPGGDEIRDAFLGCPPTNEIGEIETVEPGWKQGPASAVETLWNDDPTARWDDNAVDALTLKRGTVVNSRLGDDWRATKRVWTVAVFAPDALPAQNGRKDVVFNNYMSFFFEGCTESDNPQPSDFSGDCDNKTTMYGRFLGYAKGTSTEGPTPGTMIRILRLVE